MFDNPSLFLALRRCAMPRLRTYPSLNVWLAGCGDGAELFALAIVLREAGLLDRCRLYGTDADPVAVARAQAGTYEAESRAWERAYRVAGGPSALAEYVAISGRRATMRPLLRARVAFFQHDLASDASFNEFQLIVCGDGVAGGLGAGAARAAAVIDASLCRLGLLAPPAGPWPLKTSPAYVVVDRDGGLHRRVR